MRLDIEDCPQRVWPGGLEVTLNGYPLAGVIRADEERGEVEFWTLDRGGRRIPEQDAPRGYVSMTARGRAEIRQVVKK